MFPIALKTYQKGRDMLNPEEKSKLEKTNEKMKSNVTKLENENKVKSKSLSSKSDLCNL